MHDARTDRPDLDERARTSIAPRRSTSDTLQLPLLFRAGDLSFFDCGGIRLMVSQGREAGVRSSRVGALFQGRRHPARPRELREPRRRLRRRAPPHRPHARSRAVDGVFQRLRREHARAHERSPNLSVPAGAGSGSGSQVCSVRCKGDACLAEAREPCAASLALRLAPLAPWHRQYN